MTVPAKFKVETITHTTYGSTISLQPVVSGSKENESFYKATPGGKIELSTINPDAAKQFAPGKEFYIDFTPAS
jgi:hypothetical protein